MSETPSGLAALLKILRYLEDSERKDYESRRAKDRKGHIYEAVLIVRKWLASNMAPTDQDNRDLETHRLRQAKQNDQAPDGTIIPG
jgi:hypothetical protein